MTESDNARYVLRNARHLAADYVRRTVRPGDTVVDATMGNGQDTLFLCGLVGETGRVFAFDVQPEAVERTRARLDEAGALPRATLLLAGHETMAQHVPGGVQAVMFNLGWLPGAQHAVTTLERTTLPAVEAACSLLCPGGIVSMCVYPGHEDSLAITQAIAALPVKLKEIVLLHYYQGLSLKTCAQALDISAATATRRLQQAQARLRRLLSDETLSDIS